jgi:hypothetical protein
MPTRVVRAAALTVVLIMASLIVRPSPAAAAGIQVKPDHTVIYRGLAAGSQEDPFEGLLGTGGFSFPSGHPWLPSAPYLADERDICKYVTIWSNSGPHLAPEFGVGGIREAMIRARTSSRPAGWWEMWWLCRNSPTGAYYFEVQRNLDTPMLIVSAEMTGYPADLSGLLRARTSNAVGPWELFFLERNGIYFRIKQWTGPYVTSEENYPGGDENLLRARQYGAPDIWEDFNIAHMYYG